MIAHTGQVRRVADGRALIAVATSGCSSCGHLGGCGTAMLAGNRRETLITLPSLPGLASGDVVTLELDETQVTRAALRGYLLPAMLLVIGALIGEKVGAGGTAPGADAMAALGALLGMASGLLLARCGRPLVPRLLLLQRRPTDLIHPRGARLQQNKITAPHIIPCYSEGNRGK